MSAEDFSSLQDRCAAYLSAHPYFTPATGKAIPVLVENLGDIESRIATQVQRLGICVSLLTPAGPVENPDDPAVSFRPRLVASIIESVPINRSPLGTRERAGKVALIVAKLLHQNVSGEVPMLLCQSVELDGNTARQVPNGTAYIVSFEVGEVVVPPEPVRDNP